VTDEHGSQRSPVGGKPKNTKGQSDHSQSKNLVYVKSNTKESIINYAAHHSEQFENDLKQCIGSPVNIKLIHRHHCLLIDCANNQDKSRLLNTRNIGNLAVITSRPRFEQRNADNIGKQTAYRYILKGVPLRWSDDELAAHTGAVKAKRFLKPNNGDVADLLKTTTVLLEFDEKPTHDIHIGYTDYKLEVYIPRPMQCNQCYRFGHTAKTCRANGLVCKHCGKHGHSSDDCLSRSGPSDPKCINCGGGHEAQSKSCPKYKESLTALKLRAKGTLTYAQA
jgi:hypothetical protein